MSWTTPRKKSIVVTDGANATISTYIAQFDTSFVRFVDFKEFDTISVERYQKYLIMNGMTRYLSNLDWEDLLNTLKQLMKNWKKKKNIFQ